MTKKIVKLAVIRSNDDASCPFGLSIPHACKTAGELVDNMAPCVDTDIDEQEKVQIAKANNHIFMWKNPNKRCVYAGVLFDDSDKDVVECNWSANDERSQQKGTLVGSPFYYKQFSGGMDGLFSYPLSGYDDYTPDRSFFYSQYSLETMNADDGDKDE